MYIVIKMPVLSFVWFLLPMAASYKRHISRKVMFELLDNARTISLVFRETCYFWQGVRFMLKNIINY